MAKSKRPPGALAAAAFAKPKRTASHPDYVPDPDNVAYTKKRNDAEDKAIMIRFDRDFDLMFGD